MGRSSADAIQLLAGICLKQHHHPPTHLLLTYLTLEPLATRRLHFLDPRSHNIPTHNLASFCPYHRSGIILVIYLSIGQSNTSFLPSIFRILSSIEACPRTLAATDPAFLEGSLVKGNFQHPCIACLCTLRAIRFIVVLLIESQRQTMPVFKEGWHSSSIGDIEAGLRDSDWGFVLCLMYTWKHT